MARTSSRRWKGYHAGRLGNVAYVCAQGTTHAYSASLIGEVTFPPGYTPHIESLGNGSPSVNVTCG
jgi:hypothetical protein